MLYVPTLNITLPRAKKLKKGSYSKTEPAVNKKKDADVVDFADLATTPMRHNHNMTFIQLYKLQKENYSLRQRLQQVADMKINGAPIILEDDSHELGYSSLKLEDVTADQFRIEMANKDQELRRALDVEKEYGRKIIGLQTESRCKNNAIIGLKKEFAEMVLSLESNIQMLKSSPVRVESDHSVALASKKRSSQLSNNDSNPSRNIGPLVLPAHTTASTKQKVASTTTAAAASSSSLTKANAIDSINKKFVSFEIDRKALEDRIRHLELQLQQRSPDTALPGVVGSNQSSMAHKPIEVIAQLSPAGKNNKDGRIDGSLPSSDPRDSSHNISTYEHSHVPAKKFLHPINHGQAVNQPLAPNKTDTELSIALTEVPSSAVVTEITSTHLASVSDEMKVSHPPLARPTVTSPITASRIFRPPTSASSEAVEMRTTDSVLNTPLSNLRSNTTATLIGNETDPEPQEGKGKKFPFADFITAELDDSAVDAAVTTNITNPAHHDCIATSPSFARPIVASPIISSRAVRTSTPQSAPTEQELSKPLPSSISMKGSEHAMLDIEEPLATRGTDSSTATKHQKAALLKEKKKLKRVIHGRKDFFAKSGRDPTGEEQELIDEELRRYTQLVKALKQFGDNDAE